jgi:hypothetical protein
VFVDIAADILRRKLQLLEQRGTDIGVRKHVQHVLGIQFTAMQLVGLLRSTLQQLKGLLAEGVDHVHRFPGDLGRETCAMLISVAKLIEQA